MHDLYDEIIEFNFKHLKENQNYEKDIYNFKCNKDVKKNINLNLHKTKFKRKILVFENVNFII